MNFMQVIESYTAQVVEEQYAGQGIEYSCGMTILGGDGGGFQPVILTVISVPGIVVNERAVATLVSQNLKPSIEETQGSVREAIEALLSKRSQEAQAALSGSGLLRP